MPCNWLRDPLRPAALLLSQPGWRWTIFWKSSKLNFKKAHGFSGIPPKYMKHQIIMKKSHWKYRNVFQNHRCQAWPYGIHTMYIIQPFGDSRYSFQNGVPIMFVSHCPICYNMIQYVYIYLYLRLRPQSLQNFRFGGLWATLHRQHSNLKMTGVPHWIETQEWLALWFSYPKSLVGIWCSSHQNR